MGEMYGEYKRLVFRALSVGTIKDGEILAGLGMLFHYLKGRKFQKAKDTEQYCLALHWWTKYLACDDAHKIKDVPSKDDRFKVIYLNNYNFRRRWVAFFSKIVDYVELMYANETGDVKLYENVETLRAMGPCPSWWDGFVWATVKEHIEMAKGKIEKEPTTAPSSNYAPFDWYRGVLLEGGDGRRREVTELLEELQKLSVSSTYMSIHNPPNAVYTTLNLPCTTCSKQATHTKALPARGTGRKCKPRIP